MGSIRARATVGSPALRSGRLEVLHEGVHRVIDGPGVGDKVCAGSVQVARSLTSLIAGAGHGCNRAAGFIGAGAGFRNQTRNLFGEGLLILSRSSDGGGDAVQLANDHADGVDGQDGRAGGRLHAGDLSSDLLGSLGGLAGEFFHLAGYDPESFAVFARGTRLGWWR